MEAGGRARRARRAMASWQHLERGRGTRQGGGAGKGKDGGQRDEAVEEEGGGGWAGEVVCCPMLVSTRTEAI